MSFYREQDYNYAKLIHCLLFLYDFNRFPINGALFTATPSFFNQGCTLLDVDCAQKAIQPIPGSCNNSARSRSRREASAQ